jgi:hypothetical protein
MAAGKNTIINGAMDIWQRGTSITTAAAYTVDRYFEANGSNSIVYTRSTDVPTNGGFTYSVSRAGTASNMAQRIEAAQSVVLAGQTATLSFWYKSTAGADNFNVALYFANSADNFGGVTQIGSTQTIATPSTSWVKVSYTYSIPANGANGLAVYFYRGAGATSTTLMTGIQLELGSVATNFTRAGGTIQGELAACKRYYRRNVYDFNNAGLAESTTVIDFYLMHPTTMRDSAAILDQLDMGVYQTGVGSFSGGTWSIFRNTVDYIVLRYTHGSAVFTVARTAQLNPTTGTAYWGVSKEL